ncbi:hypothetical protein ATANTOWER_010822 [Ataeniobius toweri]|uniref:Uncharacterized protein n=1 Tax=Ataeniobius toweri TaxID=208326 RepID=A0ABU7CAS4_9TELE|nr:hypothetical protein [Ataeniobius toweri]
MYHANIVHILMRISQCHYEEGYKVQGYPSRNDDVHSSFSATHSILDVVQKVQLWSHLTRTPCSPTCTQPALHGWLHTALYLSTMGPLVHLSHKGQICRVDY